MTEQSNNKRKYFIVAPFLSGSAGVRCLYNLGIELNKKGYETKIVCSDDISECKYGLSCSALTKENYENDVVVYPEITEGNPLGFRHVVHWILNNPHFWGQSGVYHSGELLFAFDESYYPGIPCLRSDTIDHNLFYDAHTQKNVNCLWVYKRGLVRKIEDVPELKGAVQITTDWPAKREELAKLLQRTDTLYSMDDNSSLLVEAQLCGAKVKIIEKDCIRDVEIKDSFDAELFEKQLDEFIKLTQSFTYEGAINTDRSISSIRLFFMRTYWKCKSFKYWFLYILTHSKKIKAQLKKAKKMKRQLKKCKAKLCDVGGTNVR